MANLDQAQAGQRVLEFEREVGVAPVEAYRAFIHPTALRDWLCDEASIDPRPGGILFLKWRSGYAVLGEFIEVERDRRLRFTWRGKDDPAASIVEVDFSPAEGNGTLVRLAHRGIPEHPSWDQATVEAAEGWENGLENLQSVLETGIDLRLARRPFLGILMDEFTPEISARLGLPSNEGVYLSGVADGAGAQAAGLQSGDVLVEMDGQPLKHYDELGSILRKHQAGDTLQVDFYRAGELKSVPLTLSRRSIPERPGSPAELARNVREMYERINLELENFLAGSGTQETANRPASTEWGVPETLAHLIAAERDLHAWVADMMNDHPIPDSLEYSSNPTPRMAAIAAVHQGIPELLAELKQAQAVTVAMLERIPAEILARKHIYFRVADWVTYTPDHFTEHIEQMKTIN